MPNSYKTKSLTIEELENGILNIRLDDDGVVEVEDMQAYLEIMKTKFEGRRYANLVEFGSYSNITAAVREFASTDESNIYTIADAFVLKSISQRIIGNFYLKFDSPSRPTRLFKSREEALEWLKQFKSPLD